GRPSFSIPSKPAGDRGDFRIGRISGPPAPRRERWQPEIDNFPDRTTGTGNVLGGLCLCSSNLGAGICGRQAKRDLMAGKVGGSLFDWPELGQRLGQWLDTLSSPTVLLIPGGGAIVEFIRKIDRWHHLGEEKAHWLALRALTINAHFLAAILSSLYPSKP